MKITHLELTNYCNANCWFCSHSKMTRPKGFLSLDTVKKAIEVMKRYKQTSISLHLLGEPLLHPKLIEIIELFKENDIKVFFATNGKLLTNELTDKLININNMYGINISMDYFNPEKEAEYFIEKAENIEVIISMIGANTDRSERDYLRKKWGKHLRIKRVGNWSNKTSIRNEMFGSKNMKCFYTKRNLFVVLWDGRVASCCGDYDGMNVFGKLKDIDAFKNTGGKLCKNCQGTNFSDCL